MHGCGWIDARPGVQYTLIHDIAIQEATELDTTVSIGEVKRDISELVNRVAYGHERIVLTSRGKPKAALVSLDDYARLQVQEEMEQRQSQQTWFRRAEELSARILRERNGEPVDVELIVREAKLDLELRFDDLLEQ